jgi:hypothetical protein
MKQLIKLFQKRSMIAGMTVLDLQNLLYPKIKMTGSKERNALFAAPKQIGFVLDVFITSVWQQKTTAIQSVSLIGMLSLKRKTEMEKSLTSTLIYSAGTKLTIVH